MIYVLSIMDVLRCDGYHHKKISSPQGAVNCYIGLFPVVFRSFGVSELSLIHI